MTRRYRFQRQRGMTLLELAIVLLVLGVLARSALLPLAQSRAFRVWQQNEQRLDQLADAVTAHAVAYGVLPCPVARAATATSATNTSPSSPTVCQTTVGYLSASDISLSGHANAQGHAQDAYGRSVLYAVSLSDHDELGQPGRPDWTSAGEARAVGLSNISTDLVVCYHDAEDCRPQDARASRTAWVLFSEGRPPAQPEQRTENTDGDRWFAQPEAGDAVSLRWGSQAEVAYWLLRAGWLD